MKNQGKALTTLAIKARVYNKVRKFLYKRPLEETIVTRNNGLQVLTDKEKIAFFDELYKENAAAHSELNSLKSKRKFRAKVDKLRAEKGHCPKIKTSLEDYQKRIAQSETLGTP